jgi:hypothetical protein
VFFHFCIPCRIFADTRDPYIRVIVTKDTLGII